MMGGIPGWEEMRENGERSWRRRKHGRSRATGGWDHRNSTPPGPELLCPEMDTPDSMTTTESSSPISGLLSLPMEKEQKSPSPKELSVVAYSAQDTFEPFEHSYLSAASVLALWAAQNWLLSN